MFLEERLVLSHISYQHQFLKYLAHLVLIFGLSVVKIAHAYTGVTILMASQSPTNTEFVDEFKMDLASSKKNGMRVNVIVMQDSDKFEVAENSELVIALDRKSVV